MDTFKTLLEWFHSRVTKDYEHEYFCQCGTEKMLVRSLQKEKMRAFLLVAVLIDQFVYTHYSQVYEQFRKMYRVPKLESHPAPGCMHPPSWFIYSNHGYDKNVDWNAIENMARIIVAETKVFLTDGMPDFNAEQFNVMLKREIEREFEKQHQEPLSRAFHFDDFT